MSYEADVVAYNPSGELVLVAEVKSKRGADRVWATQLRRNLAAHGMIHAATYFLLALPDRFFLWKDNIGSIHQVPPDFESDPTDLLSPYFQSAGITPAKIGGQSFELIVGSWLRDLVQTNELSAELTDRHRWLVDSGLHKALRGGNIAYGVAA